MRRIRDLALPWTAAARRFSSRADGVRNVTTTLRDFMPRKAASAADDAEMDSLPPYLLSEQLHGDGRSVYMETYGCQMNVADTEVVQAVLRGAGYVHATTAADADVVLLNTCAIRENAESKIWNRLKVIRAEKRKAADGWRQRGEASRPRGATVGILGCMGERLKGKLLEEDQLVDVVCGPDAYRALPRLLAQARTGQPALDVQLSLDETYADVAPVREGTDGISAFVSIMRGCNNMCSYCIVPHTRGRERSRPAASIAREVAELAASGFREVTLLGQNVNSYADASADGPEAAPPTRDGFKPMVPPPKASMRFAGLLQQLSEAHPEMRFRFTSPHPKDFPDELLHVIAAQPNACAQLHIPAQSGSSKVLEAMRRGYTRETYLELIDRVREVVPGVALSSDFISGFCGETEEDHQQTLSLIERVQFDKAYMFAYSMREKTHAHRKLVDDVEESVKQRRLREVIETFTAGAKAANAAEVGRVHHVLVDGVSKKDPDELMGRTDTNKRVVFARRGIWGGGSSPDRVVPTPGEYVLVRITESLSANTLRGTPTGRVSIAQVARAGPRGINLALPHPDTPGDAYMRDRASTSAGG